MSSAFKAMMCARSFKGEPFRRAGKSRAAALLVHGEVNSYVQAALAFVRSSGGQHHHSGRAMPNNA
jgi:hypothetical protein